MRDESDATMVSAPKTPAEMMIVLIGLCSDTHGDIEPLRAALAIFGRCGVEYIIHCGDVGGPAIFDEFVGRSFSFVWGNTDSADAATRAYLRTVNLDEPSEVPLRLELGGKRIAVYHGHERGFDTAAEKLNVDYIFHGHSHLQRDDHLGLVRIVNPGALHRARVKTVATLDLATDDLIFHEIEVL